MRFLLKPFSFLYELIMRYRNYLYDTKRIEKIDFNTPVISVGNITVGGTGKTPIICELVRWSLEKGLKPAVVSRGYKGRYEGIKKVISNSAEAKEFGDEPVMMANMFPTVPIYVGRDRAQAVSEIIKNENPKIIFADDAFQHRRLGRQLDVVIVDCTEKLANYGVLPAGRGRESLEGIQRADFVILNKVNLVSPDEKLKTIELIESACGENKIPIIECEYYINSFLPLSSDVKSVIREGERIALLTAIGQPQSIFNMLSKRFSIQYHYIFRDHHVFEADEIAEIVSGLQSMGVEKLIVTEKDAVKLRKFKEFSDKIWVARLSPKLSLQSKSLYEKIISLTI